MMLGQPRRRNGWAALRAIAYGDLRPPEDGRHGAPAAYTDAVRRFTAEHLLTGGQPTDIDGRFDTGADKSADMLPPDGRTFPMYRAHHRRRGADGRPRLRTALSLLRVPGAR